MKTDTLTTKPKKKSLNQIFSEYPAFIERLKDENKKLKTSNDALLSALKLAKDIMTTYDLMKSKAGYEVDEAIKKATE